MESSTLLRLAAAAELALIPVGVFVSHYTDTLIPEAALELEEELFVDILQTRATIIAFLICAFLIFCLWIVALVGIFRLKSWAPWAYLISTVIALPLYFSFGVTVYHPFEIIFDDLYRFIPGLIIGLAFFSDAIPKSRIPKSTMRKTPQPIRTPR